jgi:hypothetical protein
MLEAYGQYAPAHIFSSNDNVDELGEHEVPLYDAAFEAENLAAKRHSSCDECRKRKLKCSGKPTCLRCVKHGAACHFSLQAVMGRPRKRRRTPEEAATVEAPQIQMQVEAPTSLPPTSRATPRGEVESLCPGPVTQYIKRNTPAPALPFLTQGPLYEYSDSFIASRSEDTPPTESPPTPTFMPEQAAYTWPDYSSMRELPQIVQDNHPDSSSSSQPSYSVGSIDTVQALPNTPACSCLANLYLTLSSLSTISAFPISLEHIETLQTAHRTAQTVLYCNVCPTKFNSGIQNVMLSGTVLTVLADNWSRVRTASARELRSGFTSEPADSPLTERQSLQWRTFAYQLLRANVFGHQVTPCPPCRQEEVDVHPLESLAPGSSTQGCHRLVSINSSTSTPTLLALIEAMERRQSCWHGQIPDTGEFPKPISKTAIHEHMRGMTLKQIREAELDGNDQLCLKIVHSAKSVLMTLNTSEPTL